MSSILKALKKLEEEQSGRSASSPAGSGGQFVAPMRTGQPLLLLIFGVGAGLLLAGGLYALLGRSEIRSSPPPVPQELKTAVPVAKTAPPPASAVAGKIAATVRPEITVPPVSPVVAPPGRPSAAAVVSPAAMNLTPLAIEEKPRPAIVSPVSSVPVAAMKTRTDPVESVQIERREIPSPGQQWTAPLLTVSEILSTSAGGRMAIVNGMPVMEGTMMDDLLVEKISTDQVVFIAGGRTVTVPLLKQPPAVDRQ
jgi:hypothetical protein